MRLICLSTKQGALFVHPYEQMLLKFSRRLGKKLTTILDLNLDDLNQFNKQNHLSDWLEVTAKVDYVEWTVHIMIDPNYLWQAVGSLHKMIMSMIATVWIGWMVTLLILFRLRQQTVTAKQEKLKLEEELLSRKRHEEHLQDINRQLQIQETRLQQFLEAMPVGVCVGLLGEQGEPYYYYMNRKAKGLLCYSANEYQAIPSVYQLYQAGTNQLYPPERLPLLRALAGDSSWVDDLEIHQILHTVPVEVWGSPIFDEQHQVIYAITVFQDITGRKQAEAEREQFTQELFELSSAYERFVPREFLSLLNKQSIRDIQLGDQIEKEMTILFSDIRGFTSLSEKMTPQENFQFINNYLSAMEPIIREHHGFIDKYIGDAIMALFPTADAAVQTAIAMLTSLARYNQASKQPSPPAITVGIGINTGPMMLGTVGGQHRLNGTVISDAVNLASRIEGLTKIYQIHLLITQQTYLHLTDPTQYHIRVMDTVKVKGKSENITIYEVYDADSSEIIAQKTATRDDFEVGFALYHSGEIGDALPCFERVMQVNPHDPPVQIYLDRCYEILGLHLIQAKILVVDDSPVNTEYLSQILQWSQFEVFVAEDGKTALNLAESQLPNLILLDVLIPDMDGFEICQHLKSQPATKQIPIIFMTALTDLDNKMKGFKLGAVDYITKPFHREEILARIKIHLSNHYLKQRLIEKMAS